MAQQLAEGVWLLNLGLIPPLATNAYLIDDTNRDPISGCTNGSDGDDSNSNTESTSNGGDDDVTATVESSACGVTLIDAGLFWNRESIRRELADIGYTVGDIDRVLLTHYDLDHTGGLGNIAEELTAPVYIGEKDGRLVAGQDQPNTFHHKGLFHRLARWLFPLPESLTVEHVRDEERIGRFTAYHTPGHNPGHTVYVHDSGIACLGDLVWEENGELTPPFWLDSYNMRQVHESIRRFADRTAPFEIACMGHGVPITEGGYDALKRLVADL